jgi:exopolysaccharide biosynthesis polyprenyl glycosylphosphotransferase
VVSAGAALALVGWATVAAVPQAALAAPGPLARSTVLLATTATLVTLALRAGVARLARPATLSVVLAGEPREIAELTRELARPGASFRPVAACVPDESWLADPDLVTCGLPIGHGYADLPRTARTHDADLVLTGASADHATLRALGHGLQEAGVGLLTATRMRDVETARLHHTTAGSLRVLELRPAPLRGPARMGKDLVDRVAAAGLLVALAPLLLTVAVLVRRDSSGPAIYRQVRVGRHAQPFTVYKFRTMSIDADQRLHELGATNESDAAGVLFKIRADPRITRVGSVLRRYSLDELPQLLNVLRGEMSLIGPRPALPSEVAAYDGLLSRRLVVKPGMTGLWQVSGRSDLDWEETVRLDLAYVDNWSWRTDLRIAARTVGAVLSHRGAY